MARLGSSVTNEIKQALAASRGALRSVAAFSGVINLLMLVPSLYMLQVYDRVLSSANEVTLLMLTLMALGVFVFMGALEALRSFVRFQHILSGGFAARLEVEGETARLILDINYLGYASLRQQIECLMLLFLKLLALISDDEFVAERIEFRHRAPPRLGEHRRLFGRLPLFSRPHDALVFSAALLRRPSRNANPDMHDVLTRHAEEQSRELSENRLLNRVRYLIELRLGEGYGLRQCAAELGLGSGALQRALAAGGASFRQVRDEVRRQRASEMLLAGRAIREVAKACGFAELSPFYRAFRRWHAAPPEQYRARLAKREEGYSTSGT